MENHTFSNRQLSALTDQELVERFNKEVGKQGWGSSRAHYLVALIEEFKIRQIDHSLIKSNNGVSIRRKVLLRNRKLRFLPQFLPRLFGHNLH
jgi:hypothetical protein